VSNLEQLSRAHQAFNRGDVEAALGLTHPDVEWGTTALFPGMEPVYRGREGMARWMKEVRAPWRSFEVGIQRVLVDTRDTLGVIEHIRGQGRESGATTELRAWTLYDFCDGKAIRRRAYADEAGFRAALAERAEGTSPTASD
jgi:ketosteroid isomerase-like protein